MKEYRDLRWKEFREKIFENDGYLCCECGKGKEEKKVLQVHHSTYIRGLKPWEYPPHLCETICKGCHAEIHGIIKPKTGWEYLTEEDLGDLSGECEWCGSSLRYLFHIYHEKWGCLEVGTYCCDKLTESTSASAYARAQKRRQDRAARFVESTRWKLEGECHKIKQHGYKIKIHRNKNNQYLLEVNETQGKIIYQRLVDAKLKVFDFIESGDADNFFKK